MASRPNLETRHTHELSEPVLAAARSLLEDAFDGEFSQEDWDHTLGGVHVLAWDGDGLVGHGVIVQRQLIYAPRAGAAARTLRAGYVEGMAVRADRRREGIGAAILLALNNVVRRAYAFGALSASDDGAALYEKHGWQHWQGRTFALTAKGRQRTAAEDAGIYILPVVPLDLSGELTCDWRAGDVW